MRRAATLTGLVLGVLLLTPALGAAAEFLGKWGTSGTGDGQFQTVGGIATDRNGHVYAADSRGRVEKFTAAGGFVRSIGAPPSLEDKIDEIQSPAGVAVGPNGNLYVVEASNRARVSVWSRTGRFLTSFADRGDQRRPTLHAGSDCDRRGRFRLRRRRRQSSNPEVQRRRPLRRLDRARRGAVRLTRQALDAARGRDRSGREHLRKRRALPPCPALRCRRPLPRQLRSAGHRSWPVPGASGCRGRRGRLGLGRRSISVDGPAVHCERSPPGDARPARIRRRRVQPSHLPDAGLQGIALRRRRRQPPSPALRRARRGLVRQRGRRPE